MSVDKIEKDKTRKGRRKEGWGGGSNHSSGKNSARALWREVLEPKVFSKKSYMSSTGPAPPHHHPTTPPLHAQPLAGSN